MRALFLCIALALVGALPAQAAEVLILLSHRAPAYSEALRGFHTVYRDAEQTVVLSDYAEVNAERLVREERPRVVVAMGDRALSAVKRIRDVPVVALLALNLSQREGDGIGGVTLVAAPDQYMRAFAALGVSRIGVLYDPGKSGRYVKRVMQEAKQAGVSVLAQQVKGSKEIQSRLEALVDDVDALWVLPDSTVFNTVNMEAFLLFSMSHNVPIVTFSSHYLKYGAAAALDLDYFDMGAQAAELTVSKLNNPGSRRVPIVDPRRTLLRTNESVLKKVGLRGR